jgi:type VI protein secretion system component Hcp
MPSDYYLLLTGINGESQAQGMTNNIELENWSFGASNNADIGGKGLSAGKVSLSEFGCSFSLDAASPTILVDLYTGKPIATATFTGRKSGGGGSPYNYLVITLTNCYITNFSTGGGASGVPSASISIAYEQIKYEYFTQDSSSGQTTNAGNASYNIATVLQS